mgnify:CR=1 FL=1
MILVGEMRDLETIGLALTAAEKYNQFIEDYTEFEKIIPNYQIASYIGITPQSLSRIRKERFKN